MKGLEERNFFRIFLFSQITTELIRICFYSLLFFCIPQMSAEISCFYKKQGGILLKRPDMFSGFVPLL